MAERCETCRFAKPDNFANRPTATCHRFPPTEYGPEVSLDWWCGEYRPKEIVSPPALKPPVMPPDSEDAEPPKPVTVYALGYDQTFDDDNMSVHEFGVYSTRELAEAAKPRMQQFIPHFEKYAGEWWVEAVEVDDPAPWMHMRKERRKPVKPATVYALASLGRVYLYSQIELHGVYASPEAREAAKAKIAADANQEARQDGTKPLEFTWYTWEGVPMEEEREAVDHLDDIRQWIKANIPATRFEHISVLPAAAHMVACVCWIDDKGIECLNAIPSTVKRPVGASLEVIGHDECVKWLEGDANG